MTQRDKLIELIISTPQLECTHNGRANGKTFQTAQNMADHLIANNVFVLPCAIGSTVWIVSKNCTEPFPAKFKLDDISAIGKRIFLSKESAMRYMRREKSR
jgi:hypothetical protein